MNLIVGFEELLLVLLQLLHEEGQLHSVESFLNYAVGHFQLFMLFLLRSGMSFWFVSPVLFCLRN